MKYKVGDAVIIKNISPHPRPPLRPSRGLRPRPRPRLLPRLLPRLQNTLGIITEVEKHTDIFEKHSTENDNGYIWYSQVDGSEYHFYEDEVEGEIVE